MSLLFLVAMMIVTLTVLFIGYKKWGMDAIYVTAIGCVVAANIYNVGSTPIYIGNLIFAVDSITYTVFLICVVLAYFCEGRKKAIALTYSSIAAILLSGVIEFIADWSYEGIASGLIWGLASYTISALGTWVAVMIAIKLIDKLRHKPILAFFVFLIVASFINTIIYFGILGLLSQLVGANLLGTIAASYIGKLFCSICGLIVFVYFIKSRQVFEDKN